MQKRKAMPSSFQVHNLMLGYVRAVNMMISQFEHYVVLCGHLCHFTGNRGSPRVSSALKTPSPSRERMQDVRIDF